MTRLVSPALVTTRFAHIALIGRFLCTPHAQVSNDTQWWRRDVPIVGNVVCCAAFLRWAVYDRASGRVAVGVKRADTLFRVRQNLGKSNLGNGLRTNRRVPLPKKSVAVVSVGVKRADTPFRVR
jgi:hypothetical protein